MTAQVISLAARRAEKEAVVLLSARRRHPSNKFTDGPFRLAHSTDHRGLTGEGGRAAWVASSLDFDTKGAQ